VRALICSNSSGFAGSVTINVWKFPSATCPRIEKGNPESFRILSATATASDNLESGTAASVLIARLPGWAAIPAQYAL